VTTVRGFAWRNLHYALVAIFIAVLSYLQALRYYSFAPNWDLGDFVQIMWSASHGHLFTETASSFFGSAFPGNLQIDFLAIHFSPILFLLVPVYALLPSPVTLLTIQAFVIGIGGLPLFWLAMRTFGKRYLALSLLVSYLSYPIVVSTVLHGFAPEAMIAPLGIFSIYFLIDRRWAACAVALVLLCTVIEEAPILAIMICIFGLVHFRKEFARRQVALFLVAIGMLAAYMAFAFYARVAIFGLNPTGITTLISQNNWSVLGATDPTNVPAAIVKCPSCAFQALLTDGPQKVVWLLGLLAPLGFLPFFYPLALLPAIPWFFISLFSNYLGYFSLYDFQSVFAIPSLFAAAILGLRWLSRRQNGERLLKTAAVVFVILSLIFTFTVDLNPSIYGNSFTVTNRDQVKGQLVSLIPPGASVLAEDDVYPHLANGLNVYRIPPVVIHAFYAPVDSEILQRISPQFIVLDLSSQNGEISSQTKAILQGYVEPHISNYSVFAYEDGILVLEKGQVAPVVEKLALTLNYTNLLTNLKVVAAPSISGMVIYKPSGLSIRTAWFGPYAFVPPGNYTAVFRMELNAQQPLNTPLITLDASAMTGNEILASQTVYQANATGGWQTFTLHFSTKVPIFDLELRGLYPATNCQLSLDLITLNLN
jgi:uncharacterized membrane protein